MSGGPEEIRAKVEARKAELGALAEARLQQERAEKQRKAESAKRIAAEKLAVLEGVGTQNVQPSADEQMPDISGASKFEAEDTLTSDASVDEDQLVEDELDKLIAKKAQDRWSSGENTTFVTTLLGGLVLLFVSWPLGLFSIGFATLYGFATQRRYKGVVRQELGLRSGLDTSPNPS